jgi:hypothetical protein
VDSSQFPVLSGRNRSEIIGKNPKNFRWEYCFHVPAISDAFLPEPARNFRPGYRLAHHCTLSNIIKPTNGWPLNVIDEFRTQLNKPFLYARFFNYNEIKEISEVEINVKGSETTLNKNFGMIKL